MKLIKMAFTDLTSTLNNLELIKLYLYIFIKAGKLFELNEALDTRLENFCAKFKQHINTEIAQII